MPLFSLNSLALGPIGSVYDAGKALYDAYKSPAPQPAPRPAAPAAPAQPTFVGPTLPAQPQPAQPAQPRATPVAPRPAAAPAPEPAPSGAVFYKPDPNSQQVYNAAGQPVSHEQFIAQGGRPDFSNVRAEAVPTAQAPQPVDPNATFAQQAGAAGLGASDFMQLISGMNQLTPEDRQNVYSGLGYDQALQAAFAQPSKTSQQIFDEAFSQAGLGDIKKKFEDVQAQYNAKQQELNERLNVINENPWKSEATRIGAIAREKEFYDQTLSNLQAQAQQFADQYNQGLAQVADVVNRTTGEFDKNQNLALTKLQYLEDKAQQGIKDLETQQQSKLARYFPEYLQGLGSKPGEPVKLSAGETLFDPSTGKVIYQAPYKPTSGGGGAGDLDKLLTPTEAIALGVPYGTTKGQAFGATKSKLSGEAAKVLAISTTVIPEIERLKTLFENDYRGTLAGLVTGTNRDVVKLVDNIADKVGRLRSGGAINKDEEARFKRQIGGLSDLAFGSSAGAITALNGIVSEAKQVSESIGGQDLGIPGLVPVN